MLCLAGLVLAGCQSASGLREYVPQIVTPYRIDIQQGNFITQDMVEKLQAGQTKDQVRFILGTPMLTSVFHGARWDYIFRSAKGWNEAETRRLTVFFDPQERLEKWEAIDVPPPMDAVAAQPGGVSVPAEDKRSFLDRLLGRGEAPAPVAAPAATAATAAAASAPAPVPAPAAVQGASNVQVASAEQAAPVAAPAAAPAAQPAAQATTEASENKPGLFGRMFGWMRPGTAAAGAAAATAAAAPTPAPAVPDVAPAVAIPAPAPTAVSEVAPPVAVAQAVTAPAPAPEPAPEPAAPPPSPAPAAVAAPAPAATVAAAPVPSAAAAAQASAPTPADITAAVEQWRSAWATKDVAAYLASYAPDFKPAGMTRARWEAQRRERIGKPSFIVVKVVEPQITLVGDKGAVAVFTQQYESDTFKEAGRKTLVLGNFGGKWLIRDETFKAQ